MMRVTMLRTSLAWCLPVALAALTACSGNDDRQTNNRTNNTTNNNAGADAGADPEDTGVLPVDAGPTDSGPRDCTPNPFNCVENQVREAFTCVCLEECTGGLRWNAAQGRCEEPPMGQCSVDSDCNPNQACVNVPMNGIGECNGEATCRCIDECDAFQTLTQTGCPATADFGGGPEPVTCAWLGDPTLPEGLCLPQGTGGEQNDPCMNGQGCNRNQNFFCSTTMGPGRCTKLCDSTMDVLCETFGDYECLNLNNEDFPEIGFCVDPPAMDIGTTCTSSTTCSGEVCSTLLGGYCSATCGGGGLDLCAADSLCITFGAGAPPGEESICMLRCSSPDMTGDAECQTRSPNTICRALLPNPGDPALCAPPCTMGVGCAMGLTCDPGTGRCM